ncbi:MAG: tetratricopeptide repeat protein [Terriglobales bacterium]
MISRRPLVVLALLLNLAVNALSRDINRSGGMSTVAVADLNVPNKARKEYQRAGIEIRKGDWTKAKEQLLKALAIYPDYAAAYNDLGAIYARLGDGIRDREALQNAIRVNARFVPAYVNLAKLAVGEHNLSEAERLLTDAVFADPGNAQNLMLLANVELLAGHFAAAVTLCRRVHSQPHESQALAHYIAVRALQQENKTADALSEFQTFLREEPSGPDTEAARKEMAALENNVTEPTTAEKSSAPLPSH